MKTFLVSLITISCLHAAPQPIFNGKDLDGWTVKGADYWSVNDGVLVGQSDDKKQPSILWTKEDFTDFVLEAEFKFSGHVDSGFFLRNEQDQIQIGISGSLKRDMTASPYIASKRSYPVEAKGVAELLKADAWNQMKITVIGNIYTVELNGTKVMRYVSDTAAKKGPIGLQVHPGLKMKIEFKNLTMDHPAKE